MKHRASAASPPPATVLTGAALPLLVFQAYHHAADVESVLSPTCHLPWWLLAGIGHTESGNAEGGRLLADGTTRGRILGPRLDGHLPENAIIRDTDHGVLDGDTVFDRAVGPMQFIPSTWRRWQADGNHDGRLDPNNIFDSTLAAAGYLCAADQDLRVTASIDTAVFSYNHSEAYLATVLAWGHAYRDGAATISDSGLPVVTDVTRVRPPLTSRPPATTPTPTPTPTPTHTITAPQRAAPSKAPIAGTTTASPVPTTAPCTAVTVIPSVLSTNPAPSPSDSPSGGPSTAPAPASNAITTSPTGSFAPPSPACSP